LKAPARLLEAGQARPHRFFFIYLKKSITNIVVVYLTRYDALATGLSCLEEVLHLSHLAGIRDPVISSLVF
jgi:hypothetical protein